VSEPSLSAIVQEASSSLTDEIDRFTLAGVKPEYKKVLSLRKGWDGGFGATLEEVGAISSLTRERVRQIEMKLRPIQPAAGFHFLTKALEIVRLAAPCAAEVAEAALWVEFSSDLQVRIEGLLSAAEIVGTPPGFDIERIGTERFVGSVRHTPESTLSITPDGVVAFFRSGHVTFPRQASI
jgi:hypothetical protein